MSKLRYSRLRIVFKSAILTDQFSFYAPRRNGNKRSYKQRNHGYYSERRKDIIDFLTPIGSLRSLNPLLLLNLII